MATPIKYDYEPGDKVQMQRAGIKNINYYAEKLELAKAYGYQTYCDFVVAIYRQHRSARKTANICGMELTSIVSFLKKLGVDIGARGGANNPWGKRGKTCR